MNKKVSESVPLFFLVAGEASGDFLGSRLMRALKKKTDGKVRFAGVGGKRMEAEGLESLFPQEDLAHMGLFEVLRHLPLIMRRMAETVAAAKACRPDAVITIDSPDFSFRVAKKLKGLEIPLVHYVAPSVWAWREGRAKKMSKFLDHVLALLPFEPPYFTRVGLPCTFVGHPLVESGAADGKKRRFDEKFKPQKDARILTLLLGSRSGEVNRLLPVFSVTVMKLATRFSKLHIVIPTLPHLKQRIEVESKKWPVPVTFITNDADKYDAYAASQAALACSGTVSIELALAALPTIIAYKLNWLSAKIARKVVKTPYVTLVNIMSEREVMPELLLEDCTPEKLAESVEMLLQDSAAHAQQVAQLVQIGSWLGKGQFVPSEKAADTVWRVAFPYEKKQGGNK